MATFMRRPDESLEAALTRWLEAEAAEREDVVRARPPGPDRDAAIEAVRTISARSGEQAAELVRALLDAGAPPWALGSRWQDGPDPEASG
jgi:hypothetical protein